MWEGKGRQLNGANDLVPWSGFSGRLRTRSGVEGIGFIRGSCANATLVLFISVSLSCCFAYQYNSEDLAVASTKQGVSFLADLFGSLLRPTLCWTIIDFLWLHNIRPTVLYYEKNTYLDRSMFDCDFRLMVSWFGISIKSYNIKCLVHQ